MKVLLFAQARHAAGRDSLLLPTDRPLTQPEFWSLLLKNCPALAPHQKSARLARRETYLQGDDLLLPNDEIALLPPVSGG